MAITFLDEEDEIAPAVPTNGKRGITFLDEEEPPAEEVVKPEPEVLTTQGGRKITFLDEEPLTPTVGGLTIPPAPEAPKLEARKPEDGILRPVADPFLNIGAGINDVVKGFSDAFGANNAVSQNLAKNSEWYRSLLSAGAKEDQEEIGRIMQEAEGQGMLAEIGAGLKALSVAPVDLVSQGIGSLIPFIATAGVGKAVGLSKAGVAVLQGVQGGVVGGGIVKGEIYDAVKEQLINSGVDEAKAEKAASEAQAYNGKNLDQIMLGAGLGIAASATGAEGAIRSLITRKVGQEAAEQVSEQAIQEVLRTGFVRGAVKDGIVETATEALQGGQERLAANVALGREGFDVEPMRGVFGQATLEGALGGVLGGAAGGISAKAGQLGMRESVALRDAAKAADEAKQNNAPASAAAVEEQINQTLEETPEQKVARLQEEATAAAGIELEEEGVGVEPPVTVIPPVEPTPEGAVSPVEPAVEPAVAEPQPAAEVAPTEPVAPTPAEQPPVAERPAVAPETLNPRGKQAVKILTSIGVDEDTASYVASRYQDEAGEMGAEEWRDFVRTKFEENGGVIPAQMRYSEDPEYYQMAFNVGLEEATTLADNGRFQNEQMAQAELQQNKQWRRKDEQTTETQRGIAQAQPEGQAVPLPAGEVAPRPAIEGRRVPLAAPEAEAVTPNLEPLRRVARAEQTEEDVSGLVGQGLVELYNGQPVITQAGLEALPEAERPRLNPEARKIQIDTGSNEVVAEAIAKGLRIGVDQVGTGVRMPAGWTLVEDIYVPPKKMEKIDLSDVEALAEVDEDSDIFAEIIRKKDEAKAAVVQKPEGSAFANQEEFRAAFDLRGEGHGRFATRLDLMVADGAITSEGQDLIMAVIFDNKTNDEFLANMEMGSLRPRVSRAYGRGGASRQTVETIRGRAIGYKPSLRMMQNARKGLQIDEQTAETLSTFWHEFGHAGYYSLLDKAQKSKIASVYNKTTQTQRKKFFESGVAAARQADFYSRYYAKSESEWFAQSFAEYVLTKKSDQKALVPIFNDILNKVKNIFGKLFSRKEGTPELEDIFEYIIQGKDYGSTKIWWNGMQMSLSPAIYGVRGAQPVDPAFSRRLIEREKQNRAKARGRTAPEVRESRIERDPDVQKAAQDLKAGTIDRDEYQRIVDLRMPLKKFEEVPVPATGQDMLRGLGERKAGQIPKKELVKTPESIEEGTILESRLDIPAYENENVWVVSLHQPRADLQKGTAAGVVGYTPTAVLRNVEFGVTETAAMGIAAGKPKSTIATMKGSYVPMTAEQAYELANTGKNEGWVEIGMNPIRHSYFYDKETQTPVVSAEEVVQVGGMVLAKNPVYGKREDYRYAKIQMPRPAGMEPEAVATKLESLGFGRGGIVSVVNEPDASFEGRTIIRDGKVVGIELNAAALKDDAAVERVLNHEIAESANADGALNTLVAGLTPKERKEINDAITRLGYAEKARTAEEAARAVELLAEGWRGRKWFDRAVARVEAWANKLGYKLTRRAAEYIAARNMAEVNDAFRKMSTADALANLRGARKVNFNGLSAVLIPPSEMEFAYSIAAYHGTPHEIKGRFQLAKIGTGEGATVYGWGLYFAENIDVALEYKNRLAKELRYAGSEFDNKNPSHVAADRLAMGKFYGKSREEVIQELENDVDYYADNENTQAQQWSQQIVQILRDNNEAKIERVGNLYSVDLDVSEDQLMDWDKPLSEQNPEVRKKLEPFLPPALQKQFEKKTIQELIDEDPTIQYVYRYRVMDEMKKTSFLDMFRSLSQDEKEFRAKQKVSEAFRNAGIIGIRYLDQGSRFAQPKKTGFGWLVDDYRGSNYFKTKEEAIKFAEEAQTRNYVIFNEDVISITGRNGQPVDIRESRREDAIPTFSDGSPEASTLSNMKESMAKVDAASEAKGPTTYKISEIASIWMDQGGDTRQLQDLISENTNLTPANAKKVAKVIAKQYDIQQSIATAFLETQAGLSVEALPEGVTLPKEVDPDRPKPVMQRLFDVFMGVRVPPVKIQVNEKTALKQQIRLKAAANRAAKAEQKRTAEEVVEIIKAMELLGPVRPKQVQALAKRAARVIWTSEKSVEAFSEYAAKVVENANYDADLREAKDAQKRAKQLSTQKKVAMSPQREVLEDVSKVPVNKLDDPRMFAEAVNYYLRGFKAVLSPDYVVIPDAEMESYLSGAQSETQRNQRDLDREANERLAKKYGIEPDQVDQMMESIDIIKQIEAQENRDALENLLTEKAIETQQGLRGYDTDNLRADQRSIVSSMLKVDPKALDPEERQRFIRITNNIIYNNQTNGAEYFVAVAKGQQSAREAAQDSTMVAKNRAWINLLPRFVSERMQRGWALELQSIADTFRNAFGKGAMAKMYDAIGMLDLNLGFTKANNTIDEIQEKIAEFHRNLEKKYKAAARNQDGLLAEGVVGFLIQSVPKKDEVASINQRRDLIRQDIANRRRSTTEPDRVAMADRIETILNQIDGDSVEEILNNMKREFPANHESLIWYKDTLLPQYKDFLKSFDENFNDQANNYENPNYLTIGFTSAGPSLAITPEEQSLFYDQVSLRPKQSAYTIKRVDYTEIPKDRTTKRPKEIEFNLRRNVFNGLSDQINKAYTSSGWQRIASFMKTPEAEVVFGGAANKDFFIERLNRLRLSRMRRGSMGSGGAIEKAVDSLSVISRKLGTGIALGGIYQWIKQPPDQLITAWGSGGRGDLLAKNIAPKTQKLARTLLNKFSIGRRGDASAGYKYINQMEGHQNRLERYFSESKWDQAKEQAGKIADVWMVALKSSDFLAASAAWMTYYEGELNKQDIKIDDWSKEADLIESDPARRQAAAFAEQMTDIYQGSSDPTSMATFAQSGKTGWENLVKAIFVPFNSFAIQQRMRLYSDARDAISGSKSGVGGLSGTIGGLILFHATKRYVIPAISGAGIGVLYGLMGVDMDEPDEEKQKEEANKNWRQFLADITGNLLVGGTPQIVESQFIDAMNRASYLVSLQLENDSILNEEGEVMSYDQYSKERSPFYRYQSFDNAMSLGMLEIGLGQAEQVALQTKMLATPEEMEMYTPEEQRLLYFSALSEWLYMMRLNDADFARLVGKARRDMMSAAKDREKEIKRIRSGR